MSAKTGFAACQHDGFGGGYESETGQNNFIALLNADSHNGGVQSGGASVNGYGVFGACEFCEVFSNSNTLGLRPSALVKGPLRITSKTAWTSASSICGMLMGIISSASLRRITALLLYFNFPKSNRQGAVTASLQSHMHMSNTLVSLFFEVK